MAYTTEIEAKMKRFNYSAYDLAEAFVDIEKELNEKISELEKEIADHSCTERF